MVSMRWARSASFSSGGTWTGDHSKTGPPCAREHKGQTDQQEPISRARVEARRCSGQRDGEDRGAPGGGARSYLVAVGVEDGAHTRVGGADHGESGFNRARDRPREVRRARAVEPRIVRRVYNESGTPARKPAGVSGIRDLETDQHAERDVPNMEDRGFAARLQARELGWRAAQDRRPPLGEWDQVPLVVALQTMTRLKQVRRVESCELPPGSTAGAGATGKEWYPSGRDERAQLRPGDSIVLDVGSESALWPDHQSGSGGCVVGGGGEVLVERIRRGLRGADVDRDDFCAGGFAVGVCGV